MVFFVVGLLIGAAAAWMLRPRFETRLRGLLPMLPAPISEAVTSGTVGGRLDSMIDEIERQIGQNIDRERNGTRLAILREVRDGN